MSKKDIAAMLDAPHFQQQPRDGLFAPDPIIPTRVKATLDNLVPYTGDPRLSDNPKFDSIKESIRNAGLKHQPNITRQYPDQPYMIMDGGNTRLKILNELWQETGDLQFYELNCMFYPWANDLKMLVGHMIENEERGRMLFIERALAAQRIKSEIEAEEQKKLSNVVLANRITTMGWTVNDSNLGQLLYAHDILFPIIPNTFWLGIGHDSVKKIRKILDNTRIYWDSVAKPDEGSFDEIWHATFATLDGDAFEITEAQNQLETNIALRLDAPIMSVRGEIQAINQGILPDGIRPSNLITDTPSPSTPFAIGNNSNGKSSDVKQQGKATKQKGSPQQNSSQQHKQNNQVGNELKGQRIVVDAPDESVSQGIAEKFAALNNLPNEDLMNHAFGLAMEYAFHFDFDSLVEMASSVGLMGLNGLHSGFVLLPENPAEPLKNDAVYQYIYLHQLSNWFVLDHNDPEFSMVSNHVPISFLGEANFERLVGSMVSTRSMMYAAWLKGHPIGHCYPLIEELDLTVGLIALRERMRAQS